MEDMSIESLCSGETSRNQHSIKPEQTLQAVDVVLPGCTYQTCSVSPLDMSGIGELVRHQVGVYDNDQARWRPSGESTSVSNDTHH